jgi:hypothetical protein
LVKLESAALIEHFTEHKARTAYSTLSRGQGKAEVHGYLSQRLALEFMSHQRLAIGWRQGGNEFSERTGKIDDVATFEVLCFDFEIQRKMLTTSAVVVDHSVASDPINPTLQFCRIAKVRQTFLDTNKYFLQQVIRIRLHARARP